MAEQDVVEQRKLSERAAKRRSVAEARHNEWSGLSPQQQLAALDKRLGPGVGAIKQRARLKALIEQSKHSK